MTYVQLEYKPSLRSFQMAVLLLYYSANRKNGGEGSLHQETVSEYYVQGGASRYHTAFNESVLY